jgi:DNA modification methylase
MNVLGSDIRENYALYHADCVEVLRDLPDNSVHLSVYSPPFSSLYIYSESERDMGNVGSDTEFQEAYGYVVRELLRVAKPGTLTAIHVKDLVLYSNSSVNGDRGLRPFALQCMDTHREAGWTYHGCITIRRDPVREMQKTKSDRLLFKHFRTDARRCSVGLPEYLMVFRAWKDGMDETPPVLHDPAVFPLEVWQEWANSVWHGLPETDVLNAALGRGAEDEKHIAPMPLNITERAIRLWTNPGEVVLSPFAGLGSEGVVALRAGRKFIGIELKESYFRQAAKFLQDAEASAATLFDGARG